MRALISGAHLYNHHSRRYFQASPRVTALFKNNPLIQKAMGYNSESALGYNSASLGNNPNYPARHGHKGPQPPQGDIPALLKANFPNFNIIKIAAIKLSAKEKIKTSTFVLVSLKYHHYAV
jgi:hypothetical protein